MAGIISLILIFLSVKALMYFVKKAVDRTKSIQFKKKKEMINDLDGD